MGGNERDGRETGMRSRGIYAAVDIGASSGRVIAGGVEDGRMVLEEVYRFDNVQKRIDGHDCWDIEGLFSHVKRGLAAVKEKTGRTPVSIGIDTWAVDFVLLDEHDEMIGNAVAYRDSRTEGMYEVADALVPSEGLYARTGIQRQPFNTVYQLLALKREHPEQLAAARTLLMIPDYLAFRLTGKKACEYTNATTTALLNAQTGDWDEEVIRALGLPTEIFIRPSMPGAHLGSLLPEVAAELGYEAEVVLPATHDTGSAYLSVPARDDRAVFLSSGTWSLLGVENPEPITSKESLEANFTNEGGYQRRFRYLKNIMGLWMIQSVRRELNGVAYVEGKSVDKGAAAGAGADARGGKAAEAEMKGAEEGEPNPSRKIGFDELRELTCASEAFESFVDVDDDRFLAPASMIDEVRSACREAGRPVPKGTGEIMRTLYISLTRCYARSIKQLERLTGVEYTSINIVGGGCQDWYLDQMTADACGLPVFAGPVEGTSIGNLIVQMIEGGEFASLEEARDCVARSFEVKRYDPRPC